MRLSALSGIGAVTGNGSATRLVDSTAIARVELVRVSKTGAVASWAAFGPSSAMQKNARIRTKMTRIDVNGLTFNVEGLGQ